MGEGLSNSFIDVNSFDKRNQAKSSSHYSPLRQSSQEKKQQAWRTQDQNGKMMMDPTNKTASTAHQTGLNRRINYSPLRKDDIRSKSGPKNVSFAQNH